MQHIEHPYKPRLKGTLLGMAFFAACAAIMASAAIGNDRGLIIDGIIRLETRGATIFYWSVAGISAAFVPLFIAMLVVRLTIDARLTLSPTELSAPRSAFARENTVVRRADIAGVSLETVQKQRFLKVHHAGGTLTILNSCLPSDAAFDEVCEALRA